LFVIDAPNIAKRLDVHVVFIVLALLVSAATAMSNIVIGQQLRDALTHGQYQLPLLFLSNACIEEFAPYLFSDN